MEELTMTLPRLNQVWITRFIELVVVLATADFFAAGVEYLFGLAHVTLPVMPLLHRTYLFFSFILLLCLWLKLRGEDFAQFALVRPERWLPIIGRGIAIFLVVMAFDTVVRPLLDPIIAHATGTSTTLAEQHFASVKGNLGLYLFLLPFGWIFGGFGEEILYRGFVLTRIAQLLGESRGAWIAAVILQAIPFGLGHSYQGPVGIVAIAVVAAITGAGTLIGKRSLWPAIIAHGLQDTVGFTALYLGIAHG
jgi:membrane protease YdiL (CAAX protease family)